MGFSLRGRRLHSRPPAAREKTPRAKTHDEKKTLENKEHEKHEERQKRKKSQKTQQSKSRPRKAQRRQHKLQTGEHTRNTAQQKYRKHKTCTTTRYNIRGSAGRWATVARRARPWRRCSPWTEGTKLKRPKAVVRVWMSTKFGAPCNGFCAGSGFGIPGAIEKIETPQTLKPKPTWPQPA